MFEFQMEGVEIRALPEGASRAIQDQVFTPEAVRFVVQLHRIFNPTRLELLKKRAERQLDLDAGEFPEPLEETRSVREAEWKVAPAPSDLEDRRVEITGPVERKMMINALNSGARVFMADFEDSLSPTWENIVLGQHNLTEAVRRTLALETSEKQYRLKDRIATLVVRPRGWHLLEENIRIDGQPISASLCDFGFYFFHNARELISRGSGPYFYLPKLESHLEARLWNEVFNYAQDTLGIPRGTIRATVLIETILAAFEMEEILYELREHAAGLNAGRWDYIFSIIKKFRSQSEMILPDRSQVTMTVPFMRAYTRRLVDVCHRRRAHAIGGMSAFIPSRKDAEVNANAISKVREDKKREAFDGFDGTWVAHPDLVAIAQTEFDAVLGEESHQKFKMARSPDSGLDFERESRALINVRVPGGRVTEGGVRTNVEIALQYLDSWLRGIGAAAIHNLMEDAATAEISRAELWQWIRHRVKLEEGQIMSSELYGKIRDEELAKLKESAASRSQNHRYEEAKQILDDLVLSDSFPEFLTLLAYPKLNSASLAVVPPSSPDVQTEVKGPYEHEHPEQRYAAS